MNRPIKVFGPQLNPKNNTFRPKRLQNYYLTFLAKLGTSSVFYYFSDVDHQTETLNCTAEKSRLVLFCHSLVLILILISIKSRIDNIFGQNPPTTPPPGTQLCLILTKLLTFQVNQQNKSCLSILKESKNEVRLSWC